jgi:carbonic anhydrase
MDYLGTLTSRNEAFSKEHFVSGLKMLPIKKAIIIACVDPRVDPAGIFGLELGEAAVIRSIGGRVNPAALEAVTILRTVARSAGQEIGSGWNLVVCHHTNCGIVGCLHEAPDLLAKHLGVSISDLDHMAIADPYKAVAFDVVALKANPNLPGGLMISGLVYDVAKGRIDTVVVPSAATPGC